MLGVKKTDVSFAIGQSGGGMPPAALSEGIKERDGKPAAAVDHAMATPDEPLSALSLFGRAGPVGEWTGISGDSRRPSCKHRRAVSTSYPRRGSIDSRVESSRDPASGDGAPSS
jgi:hypothetical protein